MRKATLIAIMIGLGLLLMTRKTWAVPAKGAVYIPWFQQAEYQYGLPSQLLARIAWQESHFDPGAYNARSGARGMMQIIPSLHPDVIVTDLDPRDDIFYAGRYLRENYNLLGSWSKAIAAYNWGPGNVQKAIAAYGDDWLSHAPKETRDYVAGVTGDLGLS